MYKVLALSLVCIHLLKIIRDYLIPQAQYWARIDNTIEQTQFLPVGSYRQGVHVCTYVCMHGCGGRGGGREGPLRCVQEADCITVAIILDSLGFRKVVPFQHGVVITQRKSV